MQRSSEEITRRAKLALADSSIISLVTKSASPSAAYDLVFDETNDSEIAKAARWLAILRRDYSVEYELLIQTTSSQVATDTAQNS